MLDFDLLICIYKPVLHHFLNCVVMFNRIFFLCHWIFFIKENLILLIFPFCFNIPLNDCSEVHVRSAILLVSL